MILVVSLTKTLRVIGRRSLWMWSQKYIRAIILFNIVIGCKYWPKLVVFCRIAVENQVVITLIWNWVTNFETVSRYPIPTTNHYLSHADSGVVMGQSVQDELLMYSIWIDCLSKAVRIILLNSYGARFRMLHISLNAGLLWQIILCYSLSIMLIAFQLFSDALFQSELYILERHFI